MSTIPTTPAHDDTTAARSGRHPVHVAHLVMGLAFLCFTASWALVQGDVVTGRDIRWLLPVPWLVAGAAGLAATAVGSLRRRPEDPATTPDAYDPAEELR
ncbi:MAG: hypothetical protein LH468_03350 [Nocardioides sp.]|nr:hypothetical protein [Nocardioides sp.]